MSEILAQEVKPFGIRVALIEPGVIATPIFGKTKPRQWSSYYPQSRRMLALFRTSLQNPTPASLIGDKIVEIVGRADTTLGHPVGPDAKGFLDWRSSMTDEQWIESGGVQSDEEWLRNVKRGFGMDVQLTRVFPCFRDVGKIQAANNSALSEQHISNNSLTREFRH